MQISLASIQVGQRVSTNLYGRGMGTVVAVYGQPDAGSVRSLAGGAVMSGGGCEVDIVFDDGRQSKRLPECILRGVQWKIYDDVVGAGAVADAIAKAALFDAQESAKKAAAAAAFAAAKDEARAAGVAMGLMPEADFRAAGKRGTAAAYNLRAELKRAGIKARVKGDYSSLAVYVAESDLAAAKQIAGKYEAGNFDGMTDCYNYSPSAWGDVFGDVRYVFCRIETA